MTCRAGPGRYARRVTPSDVEGTDQKILELLAGDGRMSFTDLGKATGLSTSAVHQRVKRLESRGLIKAYGVTLDYEQLGLPLTAFVSIRPIDPSQPDDSPDRLRGLPEIESCWSVAGDESYILKVRVATPAALEDLLARIRAAANVSTRTTIVLSTPYENRSAERRGLMVTVENGQFIPSHRCRETHALDQRTAQAVKLSLPDLSTPAGPPAAARPRPPRRP